VQTQGAMFATNADGFAAQNTETASFPVSSYKFQSSDNDPTAKNAIIAIPKPVIR